MDAKGKNDGTLLRPGRTRALPRSALIFLACLGLLSCVFFLAHGRGKGLPELARLTAPEPTSCGSAPAFDATACGRIDGQVVWQGTVPRVKPFEVLPIRFGLAPFFPGKREFPNPHAPVVDPGSRAVGNAVIFLRGVDPNRARPWDHPPVTVAFADHLLRVEQWPGRDSVGLVRRGETITMVSRQPVMHMLKADGAAFFGLAFPDPNQPLTRPLEKPGVVELSSGFFYFWMRAHLFVDDHPYYCCSGPDGRFTLADVPPGTYEIVCWMANWHEAGRDRDPENYCYSRLFFQPPVEQRRRIVVEKGRTTTAQFIISADQFEGR